MNPGKFEVFSPIEKIEVGQFLQNEQTPEAKYSYHLAKPEDLMGIFRLRHQVFVEEMKNGRVFDSELSANYENDEIEYDHYDTFCDHIVVKHQGKVVGTYRMLKASQAAHFGVPLYTATEFNLNRLKLNLGDSFQNSLLELGRSCVHKAHRNTIVPKLLWRGLSEYMLAHNSQHFIGCVSVQLENASLLQQLCEAIQFLDGVAPLSFACDVVESKYISKTRISIHEATRAENPNLDLIPPLMKSYLNMEARVLGGPAYDEEFNCYDFLMHLNLAEMNSRHFRKFFQVRK
jgi:L-ornithine Nalpha-acyltransferase